MKVKVYDDDGSLLWMGTVERMEPDPLSERPLRVTIEVRDLVAIPAVPADSVPASKRGIPFMGDPHPASRPS